MSRDNQIEEIARDLCSEIGVAIVIVSLREDGTVNLARSEKYLKNLVDKGYRKSTDVAEEIFAEMREELVRYLMLNENIAIKCKEENGELNAEYWKGKISAFKQIQGFIDAELKKKYTESEDKAKL